MGHLAKAVAQNKPHTLSARYVCASPSYLHDTLLPAADHLLLADLEPERLVPVARWVELPTVCQGACQAGRWRRSQERKKQKDRSSRWEKKIPCGIICSRNMQELSAIPDLQLNRYVHVFKHTSMPWTHRGTAHDDPWRLQSHVTLE